MVEAEEKDPAPLRQEIMMESCSPEPPSKKSIFKDKGEKLKKHSTLCKRNEKRSSVASYIDLPDFTCVHGSNIEH